jgi:predicted TIM-barrel fold metal-dependent hydrolase
MTGIFDIHTHYGLVPGRAGRSESPKALRERDRAMRIAFMDRYGIAEAAIMPGHFYSAANGIADIRALNDGVRDYGALEPARFTALFGTLDMRHGLANLAEVDRLHGAGFRGISWHHRFQGLPMDHPIMFAIAERMARHGMVALVHCYARGDFESPWRLRRLAERFQAMNFVALDASTSPENLDELLAVAERRANVYVDLATTLIGAAGVRRGVERCPRQVVFGSNYYSTSVMAHISALDAVEAAGLSAEERAAVLSDNAKRALLA